MRNDKRLHAILELNSHDHPYDTMRTSSALMSFISVSVRLTSPLNVEFIAVPCGQCQTIRFRQPQLIPQITHPMKKGSLLQRRFLSQLLRSLQYPIDRSTPNHGSEVLVMTPQAGSLYSDIVLP